jgi:5'-nucleotidase
MTERYDVRLPPLDVLTSDAVTRCPACMEKRMLILLTNDDGIHSPGLATLKESVESFGDVVVCAPSRDCSASSRKLTIDRPLRFEEIDPLTFAIDGTPVDCILMAFHRILKTIPDIVLSGINLGPNLGEDVFYSGTVGAAMEAAMHGARAAAISLVSKRGNGLPHAGHISHWITELLVEGLIPEGVVLNINVPKAARGPGARLSRLGKRRYEELLTNLQDPSGKEISWIGGGRAVWEPDPLSDYAAIADGAVSITPLNQDLTDYRAMSAIRVPGIRQWKQRRADDAG